MLSVIYVALFVSVVSSGVVLERRLTVSQQHSTHNVKPLIHGYLGGHTVSVGFGCPPTYYDLQLALGLGSFLWNNATYYQHATKCHKTVPQDPDDALVQASNIDRISLSPEIFVNNYAFYSAGPIDNTRNISASGYFGLGAFLGVGSDNVNLIAAFCANASEASMGMFLTPRALGGSIPGELTFCGSDPTKYEGSVYYAPSPNPSQYVAPYFINSTLQYGSTELPFPTQYGFGGVPSGIYPVSDQYPIFLPSAAYDLYVNLTGAVPDPNTINIDEDPDATKWLRITEKQFSNLKPFHITLPGHPSRTFSLPPDGQVYPRKRNYEFNGTKDGIYLAFHRELGDDGSAAIGLAWLERFYTVLDNTKNRTGFAKTCFTDATLNYPL